jgi:hypothetical protein
VLVIFLEQNETKRIAIERGEAIEISHFQSHGANVHRRAGRQAGKGGRSWRVHLRYIGPCEHACKVAGGPRLGLRKFTLL